MPTYILSVKNPRLPESVRSTLAVLLQLELTTAGEPYVVSAGDLARHGIRAWHLRDALNTLCPPTPDANGNLPDPSRRIMASVAVDRDGLEIGFCLHVSLGQ